MVNGHRAKAERMQSKRCVNTKNNLVNDLWKLNNEQTLKANGVQMRVQCES